MAITDTKILRYLGWNTQGDLGPYTMYTSRRRSLVFYPRSPPTSPPTQSQLSRRAFFFAAGIMWQAMTSEQKQTWKDAADKAHLRFHGYNLFLFWFCGARDSYVETIERQSGVTVYRPPEG